MWQAITEPQALIISAGLTVVAAIVGVMLGAWLFGNRVSDLKGALDTCNVMIDDHSHGVEAALKEIQQRIREFEQSTTHHLGRIDGSLGDISATSIENEEGSPAEEASREAIRTEWMKVRDALEQAAADPDIDGRRRAKYGRIDRRSYATLIAALRNDGNLKHAADFEEAVGLWNQFRTGRQQPKAEHVSQMRTIRETVIPQP